MTTQLPNQISNNYRALLFNTTFEINNAIVLKNNTIVLLVAKDKSVRLDHWVLNRENWELCNRKHR